MVGYVFGTGAAMSVRVAERKPRPRVGGAPTPRRPRLPVLTATALIGTLVGSSTRIFGAGVFHALRRDPTKLAQGQLWRLITPVLVQGDRSLLAIVGVFLLCGAIGVAGERMLPRTEWAALYLIGALAGHGIGEVFQPHQSGMSVAFAAILGGITAHVLLGRRRPRWPWRARFAALVPLAVLDTALRDIHGVPLLAGLITGSVFELRSRASSCTRSGRGLSAPAGALTPDPRPCRRVRQSTPTRKAQ